MAVVKDLPATADPRILLRQGDITRLAAAIVDADNFTLLGCFCPCHRWIDNAIHLSVGLQLRDECSRIMAEQGYAEPVGQAKLTAGCNLPAKYILYTIGPIVYGQVTQPDRTQLASCYCTCLTLAAEQNLQSVAFCCISTEEFHFPNREATQIAVSAVKEFCAMTAAA